VIRELLLGALLALIFLAIAVALFIAHFTFCRVHSTNRKTPAEAAGLADHAWTVSELFAGAA
jgi:hypothetical protein